MDFCSRNHLSKLDEVLFDLYCDNMEVILQSNNIVEICFAKSLLSSEGIEFFVFDDNMSFLEGSINAFPIRLMVLSNYFAEAQGILSENEIKSL